MDCAEIQAYLEPYADDELGVSERSAVEAHLTGCAACREHVAERRRFRQLLRRQPREAASPELRARVRLAVRRRAIRRAAAPWIAAVMAAVVVLAVGVGATRQLLPWSGRAAPSIVTELVGKHITYSQIDSPVELAAVEGDVVSEWFQKRLGVRVPVPDHTPAGIRLLGGRIADAGGHKAAYLFYEKGRTLMSVFVVPGGRLPSEHARTVSYRGSEYLSAEVSGLKTVFWTDGDTVFGLISMLDTGALLECADRLRAERALEQRA
jgi:anti-sigma factor RsiW